MLSDRSRVTVDQVQAELAELETSYRIMSAEFLAGFKEGRAALRKNLLAAFAKEGRALRAAAAAEISGPYRRRRKYLQKLLDVLAGEQPAADRQPAEPAAVESAEPEPEPAEKTGKGRRKKR